MLEAAKPFTTAVIGINGLRVRGATWFLLEGIHEVWSETKTRGGEGNIRFTVWTFCIFELRASAGERYALFPVVESQEVGVYVSLPTVGAYLEEFSTHRLVRPSACTDERPRFRG